MITFDEKTHSYEIDGKKAISVTQILKEIGISEDFSDKDEVVMERVRKAAEKGNYYDQLAEEAMEKPYELTEWQQRYLDQLKKYNIKPLKAQIILGTEEPFPIAGKPDTIGHNTKTDKTVILDLKATYMIYKNSVTWQTNLYSWLMDKENYEDYEKYVLHYDEKNDLFTMMKLENIPRENIKKALECYLMGEDYNENTGSIIKNTNNIVNLEEFSKVFDQAKEYEEKLKEAKKELNVFYEKIIEEMKNNNIKTMDVENFKLTYTPETERKKVDYQEILKTLGIELDNKTIKEHTKITKVKSKLTVTKKKK